jgi:copper chaperone CopZ
LRKPRIIALAIVVALSATAVAFAAQTNVYKVTGGTTPTKAGTAKKPVPTSVLFNYTVDEKDGKRPAAVSKYDIKIAGIKVNQKVVTKSCTADQINATSGAINKGGAGDADDSPTACSSKALVGTGFADNNVGADANENDQNLHCYLYVKVYNSKPGHATLFLYGHKNPDGSASKQGDKYCIIEVAQAIDMQYSKEGKFSVLSFTVPKTLLHNVPGLTTAVRKVESTIKNITRTINGRKTGYYESVGGCTKGKREFQVKFTPETGTAQTAKYQAKCTA